MSNNENESPKVNSVEDYLRLSEVTERKFPDGKTLTKEQDRLLQLILKNFDSSEKRTDGLKKNLIYDKDNMNELSTGVNVNSVYNEIIERDLTQAQMEMLHHVLGAVTECIELFQCMIPWIIFNEELDAANLREEVGDLMWYIAGLVRLVTQLREQDDESGYADEDLFAIMQTNIDKLYERFGDKFDASKAINRDTNAEREILDRDA